ncbi:MAG: sialidase family protein, partial [Gaiellaceae bacterium]
MRGVIASALCALIVTVALAAAGASGAHGPEVNISRLPGAQSEPTVAIDPSNDQVLLAGSNDLAEGSMPVYSSTDGGATWETGTTAPQPPSRDASCAGDPGVAIDATGRQYYSYLRATPCTSGKPRLFVASRPGPAAPWSKPVRVARPGRSRYDDKPAIAVDTSAASPHLNRVYVAWSRISARGVYGIVLSHSDDGGRTWSPPVKVNREGTVLKYATIAVSTRGIVYVAWDDNSAYSLKIARSTDGGDSFEPQRHVVSFSIVPIPHCGSGVVIVAHGLACVHANPILSVDRSRGRFAGRVYLSYGRTHFSGSPNVIVHAYTRGLRPIRLSRSREEGVSVVRTAAGAHPARFWAQSAVDPSTGVLWVCFYDTSGNTGARRAYYRCTVSR